MRRSWAACIVSPGEERIGRVWEVRPSHHSLHRLSLLAVAAAVSWFIATPVGAQQASAQNSATPRVPADTGTAEEGLRAGSAAAEDPDVTGRAMLGFIGGLPIGFLGTLVIQGDPAGFIGLGSGVGIIGAAWRVGNAKPPPSQYIRERGEAYERSYSEGYEKRLRERRRNAAMLGGLAGGVVGFGILFALLSQITT